MNESASSPVASVRHGNVLVIEINNPPVNATSQPVREGLQREITAAQADAAIEAIVIACAGRTFVAGGDIREFGQPPKEPMLFEVYNEIEASAKPVVAAMHGTALGGGFELGLASHFRIADKNTSFGLPEVKLGLVPGAGGSQRLPRLIGIAAAIDIASSGRMIKADEALKLGTIDAIAQGDLREDAINAARDLIGKPVRRTGAGAVAALDSAQAQEALAAVRKKARGQISPEIAAQLVLDAAHLPLKQGIAAERKHFMELMDTPQGRAMRHVFFAEREAAKIPGLEGVQPRAISCVGVAGAGTMGAGISVALLNAGYQVVNVERDEAAASAGRERIAGIFARDVKSGRLTQQQMDEHMARILNTADIYRFAPCDMVIEAVFDDLAIKQDLFEKLSGIVRTDTILATNTSYLDPNAIAERTTHRERVVGMHFFAPANIMRLLEVVRAKETSPDVLASALDAGKKLRKLSIVAGVTEGFIGNRIYQRYRRQCEFMLEEGATPQQIDAAMESWGLPMGPFRVFDLSGLDISWALRKRQAATRNPADRYCLIPDLLCEQNRFGQKTGAGWYRYENGKPLPDPHVATLIEDCAQKAGVARHAFSDDEIRLRLVAVMANEGAKILEEGLALRQGDIDLVFLNGYGWPAWLGGPMFQAQEIFGLKAILAEAEKMAQRDGPMFSPASWLVKAAQHNIAIEKAGAAGG